MYVERRSPQVIEIKGHRVIDIKLIGIQESGAGKVLVSYSDENTLGFIHRAHMDICLNGGRSIIEACRSEIRALEATVLRALVVSGQIDGTVKEDK